jgi:multiple sugar transport system permease protein
MSKRKIWLFIIPSLIGMAVFYFIPAAVSLFYAFTDVAGRFVWFTNITDTIGNAAFQLAARNTLLFIAVSVPLAMLFSFLLASLLQNLKYSKALAVVFIIPLIIPSGVTVFFWNTVFADNGFINRILFMRGMETVSWFNSGWTFGVVLLMFLFRHIGFNLILFMAGYRLIPKSYYEVARLEGAGHFTAFRRVTFIYMLPTTFFVLVISMVNAFRIFRELYLLFGQYPHSSVYLLQHFMTNQFLMANMQRLSSAAFLLSVGVIVLIWGIFKAQARISENFNWGGV